MLKSGLEMKLTQVNGSYWNSSLKNQELWSKELNSKSLRNKIIHFIRWDKANKLIAAWYKDG